MKFLELKIPPLLFSLICVALMWLLARVTPVVEIPLAMSRTLAGVLFLLGAAIGWAGVAAFRQARTTVNPMKPEKSSALVIRGIFRHTRNPMYLALLLVLCAWALWLNNLWTLAVAVLFFVWMNRFQIRVEERALEEQFGESFLDYCRRVRRWI